MTFEEWIRYGINKGWTSDVNCYTHNGFDLTPEENEDFDEGGDPCIHVIRVWTDNIGNGDQEFTDDVMQIANVLNSKIVENGYSPFKVNKSSLRVIERLMRIDGKSCNEILAMITWSQADEFWLHNIRSPEKLRKHFETMAGQKLRHDKRVSENRAVIEDDAAKRAEAERARREAWERTVAEAVPAPIDSLRDALRKGRK
jgi:hypothetical protein